MKMFSLIALAAALTLPLSVFGQTDAQGLQKALQGKPLALLNYSADPEVAYTWVDGKLVAGPIVLHGLEIFLSDTVTLKGGKIVIAGQSEPLVRASGGIHPMGKLPMQLEVDLQGAKPADVIPQLQAMLFFPSLQVAVAGLPPFVADLLPYPVDVKFQSSCHCFPVHQDGKWTQIPEGGTTFSAPSVLKETDYSGLDQMGIDEKASGTITLIFAVSDMGRVDEVWLAKPLGADLDQHAAKSGMENVFHPATLDGKPVGTVMVKTIPVNYQTTPAQTAPAK